MKKMNAQDQKVEEYVLLLETFDGPAFESG
jgi:hypothetical protein